ncbi:zinc-binding alcohol dehydrogenase family protein [Roseiconus nitratireducens]|uniref:Zinc-binding alcohol dehydrogenase family protein n=1 Tax=Roseiconus nitratireducens TaxID=2605748 RepID=A0A5M6CQH6_9BACT|nr:zinc-binding alcohol dehydrogenase family protein [Roseiconus nitratireducens]KAA5537541.1 zinc-binding alcohol dehydrogenase family protein [Roseiconus nitratireducens]
MKALQISDVRTWKQIDIPEPGDPGPGEVLVRVHRMGVCGTDVGCYLGKFPFFEFPRIPGHELGVKVLAVGDGVTHLKAGDRCCVEPYLNCERCDSCRRGHTNCCEHNQTFGVMCDGGLTDQVILPARKLHPSGSLSYDQAALVETLAIGCHAVDRGGPTAGDNVLILGAGPIGLSALEFARLNQANVVVADINQQRLNFVSEAMGVAQTVKLEGDDRDIEMIREFGRGRLADVVVDATGNHRSMVRAFDFAAFAGRVVYVGITQNDLQFPHAPIFHRRELTLLASRNAMPADFEKIVALIEDGKINTDPWITHHASFDEVPRVFDQWIAPGSGVIKAMIEVTA